MLIEETVDLINPFPGLRPFEEGEDHLFFGREGQSDELVMRLAKTQFLAVVGSSGSGKSSLVRCGLLPSLYGGYMASAGSSWRVAVFRPSDDPIGNLAHALADPEVLGGTDGAPGMYRSIIESTLRRSDKGVVDAFQQAHLPDYENLLIVADQFEELFRFSNLEKKAGQNLRDSSTFVNLLLAAAKETSVNVYVVLTMRSDFLGNCTEFRGLPEAINDGQYLIPRMNREERRSAITGPIAVGGATVSTRLVTKLLNDVGDNPDQLPILQHALMRTWDYWSKHRHGEEELDLPHYNAIGTMSRALSQHAEEAFGEIKEEKNQRRAEIIFKALTDKSSHSSGIRRPTRLDELITLTSSNKAQVVEILNVFRKPGRSFIMPPSAIDLTESSVIDISHESFMRVWERLIKWVDEEALAAETYHRLAEAARLYQLGESGIWRDPELSIAKRWRKDTNPNSTWAKRYDPTFERAIAFLDYSKEQADLEVAHKERQQRLRIKRARVLALIISIASLGVLGLAIWALDTKKAAVANAIVANKERENARKAEENALYQKVEAENERENALASKREADLQRAVADSSKDLALAKTKLALFEKARAEKKEIEALEAKAEADSLWHRAERLRQKSDSLRIEADENKEKAERSQALAEARNRAADALKALDDNNFSKARATAMEAYRLNNDNGGSAQNNDIYQALDQVYKSQKGTELVYFGHKESTRSISRVQGNDRFVTGDDGGAIHIQHISNNKIDGRPLANVKSSVRALCWSTDGTKVLAATYDQWLYVFDAKNGKQLARLYIQTKPLHLTNITETDNFIVVGRDRVLEVSLKNTTLAAVGRFNLPGITAATSDGKRLIIAHTGQLTSFSMLRKGTSTTGKEIISKLATLSLPGEKITSLGINELGDDIVIGTGTGRLYQTSKSLQTLEGPFAEHKSGITSLSIGSVEGEAVLVSTSFDKTGRIFPLDHFSNGSYKDEDESIKLAHNKWSMAGVMSNSGQYIVTVGDDEKVRLWFTSMDHLAREVSELGK